MKGAKGGDVTLTKQYPIHAQEIRQEPSDEPGNLIIMAGAGALGGVNGSIIFKSPDGTEYFRLDPDGDVFEKGKRITSDLAMYTALKGWLKGENQS